MRLDENSKATFINPFLIQICTMTTFISNSSQLGNSCSIQSESRIQQKKKFFDLNVGQDSTA